MIKFLCYVILLFSFTGGSIFVPIPAYFFISFCPHSSLFFYFLFVPISAYFIISFFPHPSIFFFSILSPFQPILIFHFYFTLNHKFRFSRIEIIKTFKKYTHPYIEGKLRLEERALLSRLQHFTFFNRSDKIFKIFTFFTYFDLPFKES